MENHDLRESVKCLIDFLENRECGESYWVDDEGQRHNADIGYVNEFLIDLLSYLNGENGDYQTVHTGKRMFNYSVTYRPIKKIYAQEIFCTRWEKKNKNGVNEIILMYGDKEVLPHIPLPEVAWLQIIDLNTDEVIFTYDGA